MCPYIVAPWTSKKIDRVERNSSVRFWSTSESCTSSHEGYHSLHFLISCLGTFCHCVSLQGDALNFYKVWFRREEKQTRILSELDLFIETGFCWLKLHWLKYITSQVHSRSLCPPPDATFAKVSIFTYTIVCLNLPSLSSARFHIQKKNMDHTTGKADKGGQKRGEKV